MSLIISLFLLYAEELISSLGFFLLCTAKVQNSFYFCIVRKKNIFLVMRNSKFLQEFKAFAVKGNAVDMAVGVIIGGAFGKIVTSIVEDLIMPPIGWLIGGANFSELKVTLPATEVAGQVMSPATINYGNFLQTLLNFIIITFCVFLMVKMMMRLSKSKEDEASVAPEPSNEEKLLAEIRDLMKERKQ